MEEIAQGSIPSTCGVGQWEQGCCTGSLRGTEIPSHGEVARCTCSQKHPLGAGVKRDIIERVLSLLSLKLGVT